MLDLASISFVISTEAAKAFGIPVVKPIKKVESADVTGRKIQTEGLFTMPLGLSFSHQHLYDERDHAFKPMKFSQDYDGLILLCYLN